MNATTWLAIVAAVGGLGGVATLILVFPQIRKLRADARKVDADTNRTEIEGASLLSEASLAQMRAAIERANAAEARSEENERKCRETIEELDEVKKRVNRLEKLVRIYYEAALEHVSWDFNRAQELRALGYDVPPAPALFPEDLYPGGRGA